MGLYTEAETATAAFTASTNTWPEGHTPTSFWAEVGEGPYLIQDRVPKSKKLLDPLHRVIHRAIAHSLSARSDSAAGNVTQQDLFYLFCIVHRHPCQIARCLAQHLLSLCRTRVTQGVFGGGFVTYLAHRMGILTPQDRDILTFTSPASAIDMDVLVRMQVVRMIDGRPRIIDSHGQLWVAPGEDGAGGSGAGGGGDDTEMRDAPPHVSPVRDQSAQTEERAPLVFTRDYRNRLSSFETVLADLQHGQRRLEDILRLEVAHAEAYRGYTTEMLRRIVADTVEGRRDEPMPPVPPQRLRDYYFQAGPSSSSAPPPDMPPQ